MSQFNPQTAMPTHLQINHHRIQLTSMATANPPLAYSTSSTFNIPNNFGDMIHSVPTTPPQPLLQPIQRHPQTRPYFPQQTRPKPDTISNYFTTRRADNAAMALQLPPPVYPSISPLPLPSHIHSSSPARSLTAGGGFDCDSDAENMTNRYHSPRGHGQTFNIMTNVWNMTNTHQRIYGFGWTFGSTQLRFMSTQTTPVPISRQLVSGNHVPILGQLPMPLFKNRMWNLDKALRLRAYDLRLISMRPPTAILTRSGHRHPYIHNI